MVRVRVLLVGKIKEKHFLGAVNEYLKRLRPYARAEVLQLQDEPVPERASPAEQAAARAREGERLLKAAGSGPFLVALDMAGTQLSSAELAAFLQERGVRGQSDIAFLIGGSTGLAPAVLERAAFCLSFGRMTLPHQMVPMILLEQVYRAFRIQSGEPYHK